LQKGFFAKKEQKEGHGQFKKDAARDLFLHKFQPKTKDNFFFWKGHSQIIKISCGPKKRNVSLFFPSLAAQRKPFQRDRRKNKEQNNIKRARFFRQTQSNMISSPICQKGRRITKVSP
jgi:hypothetical protein